MTLITSILTATVFSSILAVVITPLVILFAEKFRLVDDPKSRSHPANVHVGIVPRAGGVSLYIAIALASLIFLEMTQILVGILIGGLMLILLGLADDRYDLSPVWRLVSLFVIVGLVIFSGLGIPYISNPFGGVIHLDQFKWTYELFGQEREFLVLSNLFALLWITAIMNFVSWSSGVDGQMTGFAAISCIFLGLIALRFSAHEISSESVALLAFISAGAFLGFLPWHFYPQKIMPGFGGGALAGFLLGVLSILSWGKIGTMALVLSVPIVDALYSILRRIKAGQSPFRGDAGHFHHRLLAIGWGVRRVAVFYWIVSFLFGISALYFQSLEKFLALTIVLVLLAIFIAVMNKVKANEGQLRG